jgi:hypothetical protein
MNIREMKKHLDELASKHPLGDDAPLMITIQPTSDDEQYKCTRFMQTYIGENVGNDDLAYIDLEIDE